MHHCNAEEIQNVAILYNNCFNNHCCSGWGLGVEDVYRSLLDNGAMEQVKKWPSSWRSETLKRKGFPNKMMANLEMLTSLSNAKRLLTEVAVTKYICWKWYSPNNTIPKSSNMISLYLYLMLIEFCNNCIGKGVAHQVYPLTLTPGQFLLLLTSFDKLPAGTQCGKVKKCPYMILKKKNILGQVHWNPKQSFSIGYKFCFVKLCCIFVMLFWYFCRLHWLEGE